MKVSICIPTYEMKGLGSTYLTELLNRVKTQTYQNLEVVISDHSVDDEIENTAKRNAYFLGLDIKYFRCEERRGFISTNFNNCIRHASGDLIKFLCQDDFFYDANSLQTEVTNLGDKTWGLCSTIHYNGQVLYWHLVPQYTHEIYTGANTIGSPSLLLCRKENCLLFDENLIHIVDCDYYRMMYDKWGYPNTSDKITTVSRVWDGQHQRTLSTQEMIKRETEYIHKKYSGPSKDL